MPVDNGTISTAVLAMAAVTFGCRALPLLLPRDSRLLRWLAGDNRVLDAIGPALMAALAVITLLPAFTDASLRDMLAPLIGTFATLAALWPTRNVGVAVIIGVLVYAAAWALF